MSEKAKKTGDKELLTISRIGRLLDALEPEASQRVLAYLTARRQLVKQDESAGGDKCKAIGVG